MKNYPACKKLIKLNTVLFSIYEFRFPKVVDELFDRAVPYVMWARGNVSMATEMFNDLITKEKRGEFIPVSEVVGLPNVDWKSLNAFFK